MRQSVQLAISKSLKSLFSGVKEHEFDQDSLLALPLRKIDTRYAAYVLQKLTSFVNADGQATFVGQEVGYCSFC